MGNHVAHGKLFQVQLGKSVVNLIEHFHELGHYLGHESRSLLLQRASFRLMHEVVNNLDGAKIDDRIGWHPIYLIIRLPRKFE